MVSADGEPHAPGGGCDGLNWLKPVTLAEGESVTAKFAYGSLWREKDGSLTATLRAETGMWYSFPKLKPGANYLYFECGNSAPEGEAFKTSKTTNPPRWVGHGESCFVCIEIN
jgi:hypothetical protein